MKPDWDGVLLIVLFVFVLAGVKMQVIEAAKASVWGDMLLGAILLWVRSGHGRRSDEGPSNGDAPADVGGARKETTDAE